MDGAIARVRPVNPQEAPQYGGIQNCLHQMLERMPSPLDELRSRLGRIHDLNAAASVLEWDQETFMPPGAAESRALQVGTLREMAHEMFISDETAALLASAHEDADGQDDAAPLLRIASRDLERNRKIPASLVASLAIASARAKEGWKQARDADDFLIFAPHLQRILDLTREKAEAVGYREHPYDALLDEYEPDMRTSEAATIFADLRRDLVPIVRAISDRPQVDDSFLHGNFGRQMQWDFGLRILRELGYNFARGRQDYSAHPFTTTFSISDVRITTRINERFFPTGLFGTLHEMGHALYEQGIDARYERTPLADGTSLSTHESQSRLWENQVGRSRAFWSFYFPLLRATFPERFDSIDPDTFYLGINKVQPSLIRVEADEVTYNLHIMLRFEIETQLISGQLSVNDVPERWNALMNDYLGVRPASPAEGALQDIHWSLGAIGYFPTYALGTLMSAQLFAAAEDDLGDLDAQIATGEFTPLLNWLRTHVHRWGRAKSRAAILQDLTGRDFDAAPWLSYIRSKYDEIYEID